MQINVKKVSHVFSPFYVLYVRGALLLLLNSIIVRVNNLRVDQNNKNLSNLLIKRSLFGATSLSLFMSTIVYIPIGIANSLFNTGPIFIHFL